MEGGEALSYRLCHLPAESFVHPLCQSLSLLPEWSEDLEPPFQILLFHEEEREAESPAWLEYDPEDLPPFPFPLVLPLPPVYGPVDLDCQPLDDCHLS